MNRRGFLKMIGLVVVGISASGIAEYRPRFFVHGKEWRPPIPKYSDSIRGLHGDERWIVWGSDERSVLFHKKDRETAFHYVPLECDREVFVKEGHLVYK